AGPALLPTHDRHPDPQRRRTRADRRPADRARLSAGDRRGAPLPTGGASGERPGAARHHAGGDGADGRDPGNGGRHLSGHDCLTAIVSTVLATCSKASHAASSSSATSFIFSTVSASYSPEKSLTSSI